MARRRMLWVCVCGLAVGCQGAEPAAVAVGAGPAQAAESAESAPPAPPIQPGPEPERPPPVADVPVADVPVENVPVADAPTKKQTASRRGKLDEPTPQERSGTSRRQAIRTAKKWFSALMQGQVEPSLDVSGVPFSLDGKKMLATRAELRAFYEKVASRKGARPAPSLTAAFGGEPICYKAEPAPKDMVVVVVTKDGEGVAVCLAGSPRKVVGFRD